MTGVEPVNPSLVHVCLNAWFIEAIWAALKDCALPRRSSSTLESSLYKRAFGGLSHCTP
jgi:hypothetical protein